MRLQSFSIQYDLSYEIAKFFNTIWFVLWDCKNFQYTIWFNIRDCKVFQYDMACPM